jgi:predicted nucleic acid-binding protein
MSGKFFIDTNILVYSFDTASKEKCAIARGILEDALAGCNGVISYQVVQEFVNVATRKFATPLRHDDAKVYLKRVLEPLCDVYATIELYEHALDISQRWQYSFYDSLIIASALQAGCSRLYTEDLQHGQKIQRLEIVNPFAAATNH